MNRSEKDTEHSRRSKPKRVPASRSSRHDWPAIKMAFMYCTFPEGVEPPPERPHWPSLAQVARAFGLPVGSVFRKGAEENWVAQREQFKADLVARVREETLARLAREHDEARVQAFDVARKWTRYSGRLADMALDDRGNVALPAEEALRGVNVLRKALEVVEVAAGKPKAGEIPIGVEDWLAMRTARLGETVELLAVKRGPSGTA